MIEIVREWFLVNRQIIYFIYGQVFFILGLSIALQSRQYSRLNLARSLSWLAGFGIFHGINEWGDLFIPIQLQFLGDSFSSWLYAIQYVVLAISFAFLFQFGIELLRPFPNNFGWLRFIPMGLFALWFLLPFGIGLSTSKDFSQWGNTVSAIARYGLGFPGSILAGIGLLRQSRSQVEIVGLPKIRTMVRIAAVSLFAYSILGGLVPAPAEFFPASIINSETFSLYFVAPPPVFRSLIGLVLAISMIRALEVFNIETDRLIRRMEDTQVVAIERERIARDLHDGVLQQVYAAGLLAQSLEKKSDSKQKDGMKRMVSTINEAIDQLRGFLPQLRPDPVSIELVPALIPVIDEARKSVKVDTYWETPSTPSLMPDQISHLVAFTSEALSNAIRHAQTNLIEVRLLCSKGKMRLNIKDYGIGIPRDHASGYGLRNMRDRARLLGANLIIESSHGKGTDVILDLPVEGNHEANPTFDCR